MAENTEQKTEMKQIEIDNDETIAKLKKQKAVVKTAFTKAKNRLNNILESDDLPSRRSVRDAMNAVSSTQTKAICVMIELSTIYLKGNDKTNSTKVDTEINKVEEENEEALDAAKEHLSNRSDATTSAGGGSIPSGISRLFKSGCSIGKPNLQSKSKITKPEQKQSTKQKPIEHDMVSVGYSETQTRHQQFKSAESHELGKDMWKQLKRVSIPVFSGDVTTYESWKAAFMSCIDRAPATLEYKLLQLRQYLSGEPLLMIQKLGHSAAAYDMALDKLERKYGGKRRQIALQLEEIANFRPIRTGNAKDLERFADILDVTVLNLRESDKIEELGNGCLYAQLLKKLTGNLISQYMRWVFENDRQESVEALREWVLRETEFQLIASETVHGLVDKPSPAKPLVYQKSGTYFAHRQKPNRIDPCRLCGTPTHETSNCKQFRSMNVSKRWDTAKEKGLCFRCLRANHRGTSCTHYSTCGINNCSNTHNRLLHRDSNRTNMYSNPTSIDSKQASGDTKVEQDPKIGDTTNRSHTTLSENQQENSSYMIALRTVPVILKNGDRRILVNALLDDASTQTYINEDVAAELDLHGKSQQVTVNVLNGQRETFQTMPIQVGLESLDGSVDIEVSALTTTEVTGKMRVVDWKKQGQLWNHLKNIKFPKLGPRPKVDILIGIDCLDLHCSLEDVNGGPGEPVARKTVLGWTCIGKIPCSEHSPQTLYACTSTYFVGEQEPELTSLLNRYWEVDEFSSDVISPMSKSDKMTIEATRESLVCDEGQYQVDIPWKTNPPSLSNNYAMALKRLCSTEHNLSKQDDIAKAYQDTIEKYQQKGYITEIHFEEENPEVNCWYLPHFPVIKLDRTTTKVRIVFDASAKYKGKSLNDTIEQGPKLQRDLFDILMRFRKSPIAITCDIAEMYLQIKLQANDRPYHRFLWRNMDTDAKPKVYEFNRLVFGVNCSPFLAQFVTQEHAKSLKVQFPLASETVEKSTYMDDSMDSIENVCEAIELYEQLQELWSRAGMKARKWSSNSIEVLKRIPIEDRALEVNLTKDGLPSVKTLGLIWNSESDNFNFRGLAPKTNTTITKRNFLGEIAKIFDPLGFLSPFVVRAKILLQEIWLSGVDWDHPISSKLTEKALVWLQEVNLLTTITFPRCLRLDREVDNRTLHVFVDASQEAYGAVIYAVNKYCSGEISSRLIASKSRVSPLKAISIPRLELMAAVLGIKLLLTVTRALNVSKKDAVLWSDSLNVLFWIKNHSRIFKTFVANRVGFIQEHTDPGQWLYVPTEFNSADVLTRGMSASELNNVSWKSGSTFISSNSDQWPEQPKVLEDAYPNERKVPSAKNTTITMTSVVESNLDWRLEPTRYSDWRKLIRVYGWVCRFLNNSRTAKFDRNSGELSVDELRDAETELIVQAQKSEFPKEYPALDRKRSLPSSSKLNALQPFIDNDGLMRMSGRLKYADFLSSDAQCPIILPRHSWITKLIVKQSHEIGNHSLGTNQTLSNLSSRFWIISGREAIREQEHECTWCRRKKAKPMPQVMAPLPKFRLNAMRAFDQVGVDFAGPFLTKQGRGKVRTKRYLCLFTCLSTRAVHLEMAYGLDTDSFLNAFFRMTNRRGLPNLVVSDNGTNFVGAVRELKELVLKIDKNKVTCSLANRGIVWKFNPPLAPHFGGVFESMIKSAKRAIYAILSNGDTSDEELVTAFIGAEALINSRPLTYQSVHPQDDVPITPNHFLYGQVGGMFAPDSVDSAPFNPRRRWRRIQEIVRHFWKRWMQEWLPSLQVRQKWFSPSRNLQEDDVVVVVSPDNPRGCWPLGRIVKTYPGSDGFVRVVDVRVGKTVLKRPVTRICPLEREEDSASLE